MTANALVVRNSAIEPLELNLGDDGAGQIHDLIGNYFTSCFTIGVGRNRVLTGYCDDEFLLKSPEEVDANWNVVLDGGTVRGDDYPIGGVIVITACDLQTGETEAMSQPEMDGFRIDWNRGYLSGSRVVPTLVYGEGT